MTKAWRMVGTGMTLGTLLISLGTGCVQRGMRGLNSQVRESAMGTKVEPFASQEVTVFDMVSIVRRMQKSTQKSQISIDDFLGELKADAKGKELFSNFTAAFYSKALQEASRKYPRVIMSTESGALTVTFNSGGLAGSDQLEINQVHPVSHERMLFSLDFPIATGEVLADLQKNPESCSGCHESSRLGMRHLWGRYPKWQGVIGGEDDFIAPKEGEYVRNIPGCDPDPTKKEMATAAIVDEFNVLQHLRKMTESGEPLYRHLDFPKGSPATYPYSSDPKGLIALRPNFRFGGVWHRHHVANFIYELKRAKQYEEYSRLHLYGFFSCSSTLPQDIDQLVRAKYQMVSKPEQIDTDWMERAMSLMGMKLRDLSLNENPDKFESNIGYSPGSERSIVLLARLILEEDAEKTRSLPHYSYEYVAPKECQAIYDFAKYPSLVQFGHKPVLRQGLNGKPNAEMCEAIASQIVGYNVGAGQKETK